MTIINSFQTSEVKPANEEKPNNIAVNIALSLNKQSRWLLPSALVKQVTSNDINNDLTVSVLQKHKLKRPASCVSFHSNKVTLYNIFSNLTYK